MELGLDEAVRALRAEIIAAAAEGSSAELRFPVTGIQLEFHVAVKKDARADAKVKFWVVEAGTAGGVSREEIHRVTVTLGAPETADGRPVAISRDQDEKP